MRDVGDGIGLRFLVVVPLTHVRHDADDRQPWRLRSARRVVCETDLPPDGVLAFEIHVHQALIDDRRSGWPGVPGRCRSSTRPCTGFTPMASKYRDPTLSKVTVWRTLAGRVGLAVDLQLPPRRRPKRRTRRRRCRLDAVHGRELLVDAPEKRGAILQASDTCVARRIICIMTSRDVSIPTSIRYIFRKLRVMKPAPASSTSVSASCATMRPDVQRRARMPPDPDRGRLPSAFRATLVLDTCSAGARPKMIPVSRHTARKNAMVRQSISNTIQYGLPAFAVCASNQRIPKTDRSRAERSGETRQQHRFDEELPDDMPSAGAERDADADLVRAMCGAREQQVGDVRARDQQHEADRAHQRPEQQPELRSVDALVELVRIRARDPCWSSDTRSASLSPIALSSVLA